MSSTSASIGAVAAAAAEERRRHEEEEMTKYTQEDLNNWEFKILRANKIGGFKSSYELKKVLEEEAQNGWQLVEKFDDYRLRFKRKITDRENDNKSKIDPYRTIYGMSNIVSFGLVMGLIFGFTFLTIIFITLITE